MAGVFFARGQKASANTPSGNVTVRHENNCEASREKFRSLSKAIENLLIGLSGPEKLGKREHRLKVRP